MTDINQYQDLRMIELADLEKRDEYNMSMKSWEIKQGDALKVLKEMSSESVQCVVTSPPYYGLRDYGVEGQLGLESRPDCLGWATGEKCGECYICHLVAVFAEMRRVLRRDGVCWLNIGDSYVGAGSEYAQGGSAGKNSIRSKHGLTGLPTNGRKSRNQADLAMKQMRLIPARLALALQADGWYVRSDVIWHKRAPMPESVADRPTRSHEYVYLLTKSAYYYYDAEAVREPLDRPDEANRKTPARFGGAQKFEEAQKQSRLHSGNEYRGTPTGGRNLRSVWSLGTYAFPDAHFATFPPELPSRCIKAGTSEYGCCPQCAAPYERIIEHGLVPGPKGVKNPVIDERDYAADANDQGSNRAKDGHRPGWVSSNKTTGWQATCKCDVQGVDPCVVLDPFSGAGTTGMVARQLNRNYIGIELNPEYVALSEKRIAEAVGVQAHEIEGLEVRQAVQLRMIS